MIVFHYAICQLVCLFTIYLCLVYVLFDKNEEISIKKTFAWCSVSIIMNMIGLPAIHSLLLEFDFLRLISAAVFAVSVIMPGVCLKVEWPMRRCRSEHSAEVIIRKEKIRSERMPVVALCLAVTFCVLVMVVPYSVVSILKAGWLTLVLKSVFPIVSFYPATHLRLLVVCEMLLSITATLTFCIWHRINKKKIAISSVRVVAACSAIESWVTVVITVYVWALVLYYPVVGEAVVVQAPRTIQLIVQIVLLPPAIGVLLTVTGYIFAKQSAKI